MAGVARTAGTNASLSKLRNFEAGEYRKKRGDVFLTNESNFTGL
jgi:hypothetical protein